MDFFETLYSYATMLIVGIVLSLFVIMLFVKAEGVSDAYKMARRYLAVLYVLIAFDLVFSLLAHTGNWGEGADTLVDVFCYTPVSVCFALMCSVLLDEKEVYHKKIRRDVLLCPLSMIAGTCAILIDELPHWAFISLICAWAFFIVSLGVNILRSYTQALMRLDEKYSLDKVRNISWLRNGFVFFVVWGLCCPIAAVCPMWFNTIYASIGGVIYIYIGVSILNYSTVCQKGYDLDKGAMPDNLDSQKAEALSLSLHEWVEAKGYMAQGITEAHVAKALNVTIPDVLFAIRNEHYSDFRNFIVRLRVREAQELLVKHPKKSVLEIAQSVGYISASEFNSDFHDMVGVTPQEWREGCLRLI